MVRRVKKKKVAKRKTPVIQEAPSQIYDSPNLPIYRQNLTSFFDDPKLPPQYDSFYERVKRLNFLPRKEYSTYNQIHSTEGGVKLKE